MTRKAPSFVLCTAFLVALSGPAIGAETAGRWLHVRVMDTGERQEKVKLNLPVSVLETLASSIEADHMKDGRVQLGDSGLKPEQLRAMWQALRSSGDMEFVTVESSDETVRVARSGNYMLAKIRSTRDGDKGRDRVDVKLPLKVVDALLDAPEGQLNFKGALQILAAQDEGDLVTIQDDTSDVRIWIDSRNDTEE